jgi:pimeloyl-ACP methyl ester carboxylesterase
MPRFYEALGSQIGTICDSAAQARDAGLDVLADLPLTVISASTSSHRRLELNEALARRSSGGRHIVAQHSGHWIPLDEPAVVTRAIVEMLAEMRSP